MKKRRLIMGAILFIWFSLIITDFSLSRANKSPIFSVPLITYKDGGSAEFYGLGYKVIKYVNLTAEKGPEVMKYDFGTWFMKFSYPDLN